MYNLKTGHIKDVVVLIFYFKIRTHIYVVYAFVQQIKFDPSLHSPSIDIVHFDFSSENADWLYLNCKLTVTEIRKLSNILIPNILRLSLWASPILFLQLHRALVFVRVARWYSIITKIQIWVNFGGTWNGKCWYIWWPFGIFEGHLV
jgi:hypothetical protein